MISSRSLFLGSTLALSFLVAGCRDDDPAFQGAISVGTGAGGGATTSTSTGQGGEGGTGGAAGTGGSGGSGGMAGAGGSGGATGGGGAGGGECATPADCPPAANECETPTCAAGICGVDYADGGTAANQQTTGDCQTNECDGVGHILAVDDNLDVPDDNNPCTTDTCAAGAPKFTNVAAQISCGAGLVCDGAGSCVGCVLASDCPGMDDECKTRTCNGGMCGFSFTASGFLVASQTAGNCQKNVCDGVGNKGNVPDNADLPIDGNACTSDLCTNGVPSNPATGAGSACNQGGTVCNGAGVCVGCVTAATCPGMDTACQTRSCTAGACGFSFTAVGTFVNDPMVGDCKRNECDGVGNIAAASFNSDVPVDGITCTLDVCTAGVPTNPPAPAGTACNQNGGTSCNGSSACVQCSQASDCGANTACATRTCTAGVCGSMNAAPGTVVSNTPGDCQKSTCDGAGNIVNAADNADVPVDNLVCTNDLCTNGVGSNPPLAADTPCSQNGAFACNGAGTCTIPVAVVRVGDGSAALSSSATPVFIEELDLTGALMVKPNNPLALPTAQAGGQYPFTLSGTATSEGGLTRSENGNYLVLAGYGAVPGTASVSTTASVTVNRVAARIGLSFSNVDTSTRFPAAFSANSVRGAATSDGLTLWAAGTGGGSGGVFSIGFGTLGGVQVSATPSNARCVGVFAGQLYGSAGATPFTNVFSVGTGLPTASGQTSTSLPGMPTNLGSPYGFALLDLDANVAGVDTLYVADDRTNGTGGVQKWTFDGVTWTLIATFKVGVNVGARGLAARFTGTSVILVATTGATPSTVVTITDDFVNLVPTAVVIATAPANTAYRGLALGPI